MILMLVKHPRSSFFALNMDILAVYLGYPENYRGLLRRSCVGAKIVVGLGSASMKALGMR